MFKRAVFSLFFCVACLTQSAWADPVYVSHTQLELISPQKTVQPGSSFWIGLHMKMDEDWHVYWHNAGDSGYAPSIKWQVPEGVEVGELRWPYPERIDYEILTSYGYHDSVFLFQRAWIPKEFSDPQITVGANVDWLVCEKICIPGKADLTATFTVLAEPPQDSKWRADFEKTQKLWPVKNAEMALRAYDNISSYAIDYDGPLKTTSAQFFPYSNELIDHVALQTLIGREGGFTLIVPKSTIFKEPAARLNGVLVLEEQSQSKAVEVDVPVEVLPLKQPVSLDSSLGLWTAIIFAFLGGLILNLMPCVLPVLSIKVLSLIEHRNDKKVSLSNGLLFGLGVLVSFWVLAGALIFLRWSGSQIGWGFQFQSPVFVGMMAFLFVAIALNLFGIFEVGAGLTRVSSSRKANTALGAFSGGVLTTVVATPCTAPFMGAALGYALTQSNVVAFLIFTSLGAGLAAPYILLSAFPGLLKFVPKPGAWMIRLKQFFGLLMVAAVIWLLWVFGLLIGGQGVLTLGAALVVFSAGLWAFRFSNRAISIIMILASLFAGVKAASMPATAEITSLSAEDNSGLNWQVFSPELVESLRRQNKSVFVDFTAAWCISCQVNERIALKDKKVIARFNELGIIAVKADWTHHDPVITKALEALGKKSIPLYVFYPKDGKDPVILPEVITPNIVLNIIK